MSIIAKENDLYSILVINYNLEYPNQFRRIDPGQDRAVYNT